MYPRKVNETASFILIFAGVYLFVAVFLRSFNTGFENRILEILFFPGSFLFESFLWSAFFVPLYFFGAAILLHWSSFRKDLLFVLTALTVPFFTAALFLHVLLDSSVSLAQMFISTFGKESGAFLLFLLFVLEIVLIYRIKLSLFGESSNDPSMSWEKARKKTKKPAASDYEDIFNEPFEVRIPDIPEVIRRKKTDPKQEQQTRENDNDTTAQDEDGEPEHFVSISSVDEIQPVRITSEPGAAEIGTDSVPEGSENSIREKDDESPEPQRLERIDTYPVLYSESGRRKQSAASERSAVPAEEAVPVESAVPAEEEIPVLETADYSAEPVDSGDSPESEEFYDPNTQDREEEYNGQRISYTNRERDDVEDAEFEHFSEEEVRRPIRSKREFLKYDVPIDGILNEYDDSNYWVIDEETKRSANVLTETLQEFRIEAEVTGIRKGPVITMFEILPAPGVKLSKIVNLADNIALRLAASRVRIVAPIPGKHAVGIEVPNKKRAIVSFREMLGDESFDSPKLSIPVALGKNIAGDIQLVDLTQMPHMLIAGATGSGKSVCVNSLICSILYKRAPSDVRLMLIDPKIVELKLYNDIPHLLTPVITEPKRAFQALQYCLYEMERRYSLLDSLGVRDITSYNKRIKERGLAAEKLPYIVIIVDEFADLMATSGKELESTLARLAAMSRAVGIHLVLATQRPSIDVITGLIKANIPSRIAFMVASKTDSRIIIDTVGAEKLLGKGDMLFVSAWDPVPIRIQGAFLSEEEAEEIVGYVKTLGEPDYIDEDIFIDDDDDSGYFAESSDDPLMDKALEIVATAGKASASYLQRRLKIGYNRAARLVEEMEERGIVGPQNGSKPREVLNIPEGIKN
ncbi:MAG: DNA translocase FtsK [Spirochaetia bacterium]